MLKAPTFSTSSCMHIPREYIPMPSRVRKPFIALSLMLFLVILFQCSTSLTQERWMGGALPLAISDQRTFVPSLEPIEGDQTPPETVAELIGTVGADGWFVSPPTVYLISTDVESGVLETFFSFDGVTWNLYSEPFLVTPEGYSTLYYFSTDLAGNIETTKMKTMKLDTVAPFTAMARDGNLGYFDWYVSPITVTLTAIDETSGVAYTEYSFDGVGWSSYLEPIVVVTDGSSLLMFRSVDMAGNTEVAQSATITIDRLPPTTNAELSGSLGFGGWYLSDVVVTFIPVDPASGVADTEYSFDGITWTSYLVPLVISNEGVSRIYFWSADFAGNTEQTRSVSISIDKTPPETIHELTGVSGLNGWYVSDISVMLTGADLGSGVSYTEYSFDGISWVTYDAPFSIAGSGVVTLYFRSFDSAGNTEQAKSVMIYVDVAPPVTTAILSGVPGRTGWYGASVRVSLSVVDDASGVAKTFYSQDGVSWSAYTEPFAPSSEGSVTFYYYSSDLAGNTESIDTMTVWIDMTPPTTSVELDGAMGLIGWYVSDVTVALSADDAGSGVDRTEYSLDMVSWTTYSASIVVVGDGIVTVYYRSADLAGNVEEAKTADIYIDKTQPRTEVLLEGSIGLEGWFTSDVTVTLSATDDVSGVGRTEFSLNNIDWNDYAVPFIISFEGVGTLYYRSVDVAGNVETTSSVAVAIDKSAPVTELDTESYYASGLVVLMAADSVSGVADTYCRVNEGEWMVYSEPFPLEREGNAYVIDYYSVDKAGNLESPKSTTLTMEELKVSSFVSHHRYSPHHYRPLDSLDVYFVKSGWHGYRLVTREGQFWYNIEITNVMSATVLILSITPNLPSEFQMTRLAVWVELSPKHVALAYVYLNRTHGCPRVICPDRTYPVMVSFDGHTVTVVNLPAGARVWVTIEMDYGLRNALFKSPEDFTTESYTFSATAQVMGTYHSSYNLPVVNHGVKCHCLHHWSCHFWVAAGHRHHC